MHLPRLGYEMMFDMLLPEGMYDFEIHQIGNSGAHY